MNLSMCRNNALSQFLILFFVATELTWVFLNSFLLFVCLYVYSCTSNFPATWRLEIAL
jgi:hypothetical protein